MSQSPHDLGYLDYGQSASRSPGRHNYGVAAFPTGMSLPRQQQRQFEAPLGGASGLYNDRHGPASYNPRGMDTMTGGMPNYMMEAQQGWNYAGGGAATVNGALNGPGRQRSMNRRAALPQVCAS